MQVFLRRLRNTVDLRLRQKYMCYIASIYHHVILCSIFKLVVRLRYFIPWKLHGDMRLRPVYTGDFCSDLSPFDACD